MPPDEDCVSVMGNNFGSTLAIDRELSIIRGFSELIYFNFRTPI